MRIGLAREFAGDDPIAIVLGDNILHGSLREFADRFGAGEAEAGAVLKEVPDPERFGVAEFDDAGRSSASRRSRRIRRAT